MPSNRDTVNSGIDSRVFQNSQRLVTGTKANEALKLLSENYANRVDDILDVLNSTEVDRALSANQGRVLNNKIESFSADSPLTFNSLTKTYGIPIANGSQSGALSSTDWTTFNGKQNALSGTGFVKISGSTISYDNKNYIPLTGTENGYPVTGDIYMSWNGGNGVNMICSDLLDDVYSGILNSGTTIEFRVASGFDNIYATVFGINFNSINVASGSGLFQGLIYGADYSANFVDGSLTNRLYNDNRYLQLSGGTLTGALTLTSDPTNALHAATKSYVDNLITGVTWKNSVLVATTANITLSGLQTIDGISVIDGSRVLVKNQSTQTENGIYIASSGAWTRSTDADTGSEIETATVFVEKGTANKDTQWTCTAVDVNLGVTNVTFGQIAGAGTYTNGTGILLTGNVFSLDLTRISTSLVTGLLSAADWTTFNGKQDAIGYVPFNKAGDTLTGTGGAGFVGYNSQSSNPSTPANGFRLFADNTNRFEWIGSNGYTTTLDSIANTADRVYTFPDSSGNVMLNPMTTLGDIIYGGASGVPTRIGGNITTRKQYLASIGNGSAAIAPSYRDFEKDVAQASRIVGNVYTEGFAASTIADNYTVVGAASFTQGVGKITVNGSSSWAYLKNYTTASDKVKLVLRYQFKTNNTQGIGVGLQGITNTTRKLAGFLDTTTASAAFLNTFNSSSIDLSKYILGANTTMNVSVNDIIRLEYTLTEYSFHLQAYNETTGASIQLFFEFSTGNSNYWPTMNFVGNAAIYANGGSHDVLSFTYEDLNEYPDFVLIGDSIAKQYNIIDAKSRVTNKLQTDGYSVLNFSSHGALTTDYDTAAVINTLNTYSVGSLKPVILLQVGSNDVAANLATALTNHTSLITRLQNAGFTVRLMNLIDRTGITANINSFNTNRFSTYSSTLTIYDVNGKIGVYSSTNQNYAADGIHILQAGADVIYRTLKTSLTAKRSLSTTSQFITTRQHEILDNAFPIPTTAGALIGTSDTQITVTGTTVAGWPSSGYITLLNFNTGAFEFAYYASRTNSILYVGANRGLFNTTAISTATISHGRIAYVDKVRAGAFLGQKATYFEFGAVTNSAFKATGYAWGRDVKIYNTTDQYIFQTDSNSAFRIVNIGASSDNYINVTKGATGVNTWLTFGFLNGSGLLPSLNFAIRHNTNNRFDIGPFSNPTLGITILGTGFTGINQSNPNSNLQVSGSIALAYNARTSNYTIAASDYLIDCTSGTFTVTLPTAASITGRCYKIKNSGAGVITVATTSSQTIDGLTTQSLSVQYAMIEVMSNGTNWIIIDRI
jgi:hypothetical protein